MSVGTGTVGSGTQIKYVSWGAGDTLKDIFDGIAGVMTGSGGWTLASGASGSFYTTYYSGATTDIRRVYSSPLLSQGSGLSTKYVMLRVTASANITVGGSATSGFAKVQLIPFQSWNSGTDVGTNQAGIPIINNSATTYGFDTDFLNTTSEMTGHAPCTIINTGGAGLLYVGFSSNAAYLVMWPYYSVNGQLFNSQRVAVLVYGEVSEDVASYTNCPPVYVSTLQKLSGCTGLMPTVTAGAPYADPTYANGTQYTPSTVFGANNTNIGAPSNSTYGFATNGQQYLVNQPMSCGPMWLSPVAPGSTTGYSGIANTVRTGQQASAFQRLYMGHMGEYGFAGAGLIASQTHSLGPTLINGYYTYLKGTVGGSSNGKYAVMRGDAAYSYTTSNTYVHSGVTALNSTNFKGIEPILGGGCTIGYGSFYAGLNTAYFANPFPLLWQWGRMRGLKFVGSPPTPASQWSTLDTVSMTCDADGFYTKTGGTATTFALIGMAPFQTNGTDWGAGDNNPCMFWAIPA